MEREKNTDSSPLEILERDFGLLRNATEGTNRILKKLEKLEANELEYLLPWEKLSREHPRVYPSQGLLQTPYDFLDYRHTQRLPHETIVETLRLRMFFLEMFNHPYRLHFLAQTTNSHFAPPPKVDGVAFDQAHSQGLSLSVGDLGASVVGGSRERTGRTERYAQGPFVKLGKQGRTFFVGSESPDVWNSAAAIATMAASHCLAAIPRNGLLSDIARQADVAKETFGWLDRMADEVLENRPDREFALSHWKNNVMGALEATPEKALQRAHALCAAGVRSFRVYSPEPGIGPIDTVQALKKEFGNEIEIFTGQIVDVDQAKKAQAAGSDGLFVGIGGGGRCITGVRSGSVIDWPGLVWKLRGNINIPVIVQGGASDHVAITLLLGASGIGVSRIVAGGTIESPGGALFFSDGKGNLFKPYGGEASARTKFLDGKVLPFNIPSFVEGETTQAKMSYIKYVLPTLTYNLHLLIEDAILAMVFRNSSNVNQLHTLNPSPLRQTTSSDQFQRNTH
jgi:hypothetical protein